MATAAAFSKATSAPLHRPRLRRRPVPCSMTHDPLDVRTPRRSPCHREHLDMLHFDISNFNTLLLAYCPLRYLIRSRCCIRIYIYIYIWALYVYRRIMDALTTMPLIPARRHEANAKQSNNQAV